MLSIRGVHISPSAIEQVLRAIPELTEAYELTITKRNGQDHVTVTAEPRPDIPIAQHEAVAGKVSEEVSSMLEVKVEVDLRPAGSMSREFKVRRIRDLRNQ